MSEQDRSFVTRLFAWVIAFVLVFIIVAIVGGFVMARLMGYPVDVDKFYALIGPPFLMALQALLMRLRDRKNDEREPEQ